MPEVPPNTQPPVATRSHKKLIYIIIGLIVLLIPVSILAIKLLSDGTEVNPDTNSTATDSSQSTAASDLVKIKHIGINLTPYDPTTKTVGDIVFTDKKLSTFDIPYFDYGYEVPANSAGPAKRNPQPTFIVPLGTKVHSLIDGVVVAVPKLYSNDYSVQVAANMDSSYYYETEHVINPLVKVGDVVTAGQVIAEVSGYDAHNYAGFGLYEIGILKGGNPPSHICPFQYLDDSIKESTFTSLRSLYKAWNEYRGAELYDEDLQIPGCITTEPIEG